MQVPVEEEVEQLEVGLEVYDVKEPIKMVVDG